MKPRALLAHTVFVTLALSGLTAMSTAQAAGDAPAPTANAAAKLGISNGWVRWLPNGLPEAGYLTITNNGDQPIDLLGASSPDFGSVMLHQSVSNGSTERMMMVDKLTIPAHGKVDISPGGYHLMLMSATHPIAPGTTVEVVLKFSNGKTLATTLPVRPAGTQ